MKGKFEYKEGDKVRCKKFYKRSFSHLNLYNGSEYTIENIWIIAGSGDPSFKSSSIMVVVNGAHFKSVTEFYNYFYSKKELRKLKLDKINKN